MTWRGPLPAQLVNVLQEGGNAVLTMHCEDALSGTLIGNPGGGDIKGSLAPPPEYLRCLRRVAKSCLGDSDES